MSKERNASEIYKKYTKARRSVNPEGSLTSTGYLRTVNVISVLRVLYKEGSCSRSELSKLTGISLPTITRILTELLKKSYVVPVGHEQSSGGRRPELFRLNSNQLMIIGIYLRSSEVILSVANVDGKIIEKRSFIPFSLIPEEFINELVKELWLLIKGSGIEQEQLVGIGVAVAGVVDNKLGTIIHSNNLSWNNVAIGKLLEERTGGTVIVENDANSAALAELWFGCAKEVSSLVYLKTDTGVGAGLICERRLISGPFGMAGEIGNLPVLDGVVDDYLHLPSVFRHFEELTGERVLDEKQFSQLIKEEHPVAQRLYAEAVEALTRVIVFAEAFLGTEMVVIGGYWGTAHPQFVQDVVDKCRPYLHKNQWKRTPLIVGSELGKESDLRGAVGLVIHQWFEYPV